MESTPTMACRAEPLGRQDRIRIDICIATFRRPVMLEALLRDLSAQQLPKGVSTHIIVVDNDVGETARPVVMAFRQSYPSVDYLTQPERSISLTRNCALEHASGDLIALIDDDESAPASWLASLLATMQRFSADVVLGPVEGLLPEHTPAWIPRGRFFRGPSLQSGMPVPSTIGGAGNALLRASAVRGRFAFDPRFGLSGSEDTDLFHRMRLAGAKLVWCREARLTEHVPDERLTVRWLLRRAVRTGQTYTEILDRPSGAIRLAGWSLMRVMAIIGAGTLAIASYPMSRATAMQFAITCASNVGQFSWLFSYRLLEYEGPL